MNRGGGSYCAMGLCRNYYRKTKFDSSENRVSFHSFPKNLVLKNFVQFFDLDFMKQKGVVDKIVTKLFNKVGDELPLEVVHAYAKQRVFIRIKFLNKEYEEELFKKRKAKSH